MPSLGAFITEQLRQAATGDVDYYKSLPYAFKLITVAGKGPTGMSESALFPLPIAPEELDYTLDFASELTGTQEGGLIAEEGGIITGDLRIRGTTGARFRKCKDTSMSGGGGRFTGELPKETSFNQELSGQMAVWRLLGRCFDSYSELKKDPETAHRTRLEFHAIKDRLHLEIKPLRVKIIKNPSPYRVFYGYEIDARVIGPASALSEAEVEGMGDDLGLLEFFGDAIAAARGIVQGLEATVTDLNACMSDIQRHLSSAVGIVGDITRAVNAVKDLASGAASFYTMPQTAMRSLLSSLADAVDTSAETDAIPPKVTRALSNAEDAIAGLAVVCRPYFQPPLEAKASRHAQHVRLQAGRNDAEREAIQDVATRAENAPASQSMGGVFNSPYLPGDQARLSIADPDPALVPHKYAGFFEITIARGDSIEALAYRHLGDADRWREIVAINALRPPYISQGARIPGTVRIGDPLSIPLLKDAQAAGVVSTGDPAVGASQAEAFMGRDIKTVRLENGKYGWACDTAHGSTDVQTIYGLKNLIQGIETRFRTEQRTNPQFPADGMPPMVGEKGTIQLWTEVRFALDQQIMADPRIERVLSVEFEMLADTVTINIGAQPVGYSTARSLPVQLR